MVPLMGNATMSQLYLWKLGYYHEEAHLRQTQSPNQRILCALGDRSVATEELHLFVHPVVATEQPSH